MVKLILFAIFVGFIAFESALSFLINCNYRMQSFDVFGSVYSCYTTFIPTSSGNRVTNVTGTHLSGRNNSNVEGFFVFDNWSLSFFPQGFSNFFPNIKVFEIQYSAFDTLYGDEFDEFPELQGFYIRFSNLTTISSRLFEKTPKLRAVDFHDSKLQRVGHNLFTPLNVTQLFWVCFRRHTCINRYEHNGNQATINSIINELRQNCPFDDEEQVITTPATTTTTTTTTLTTTTEGGLTCSERRIEDLVCDLKDEMEEVQDDLTTKSERMNKIELELRSKDEIIQDLKYRMKWLETEVLRLTTHPCACK